MKDLIRDLLPWYSNNLEPEPRAERPIRHQLFNSMSFDSPLKQHFLSDGANIYSPSTPSASSRRRLSLSWISPWWSVALRRLSLVSILNSANWVQKADVEVEAVLSRQKHKAVTLSRLQHHKHHLLLMTGQCPSLWWTIKFCECERRCLTPSSFNCTEVRTRIRTLSGPLSHVTRHETFKHSFRCWVNSLLLLSVR